MSDEEKSSKAEEAVSEAKGVAESFVQTLGLLDLILGGLVLYWARLSYGTSVTTLLEPTGYVWVDIALLACAAAFTGKVLSLVSNVITAVVELIIQEKSNPETYSTLKSTLTDYRKAVGHTANIDKWEQVDIAAAYVIKANPQLRVELDRLRATSTISYSAIILAVAFSMYFMSKATSPAFLIIALIIVAGTFAITAVVAQIDFLVTIRNNLAVLLPQKLKGEGAAGLTEVKSHGVDLSTTKPLNVTLSLSAPINLSLAAANPIVVELAAAQRHLIKEKSMKFTVKTSEPLKVRQAAQLLTALVILDNALSINSVEEANHLLMRLNKIKHENQTASEVIRQLGNKLLNYEEAEINDELRDMIVGVLGRQSSQEDDLELISLTEGSAVGIIKKIIEGGIRRVRRALKATANLLPNRDPKEYRATVVELVKEKQLPPEAQTVALGLVAMSEMTLIQIYKDMKAESLDVDEGLEDDKAPSAAAAG